MEARTLALGDWSRPVRDPIDLLRISYAVGVPLVWLVRGDYPLNLTISAIVVIAVRFLLLPRLYDLAFCLGLGACRGRGLGDGRIRVRPLLRDEPRELAA